MQEELNELTKVYTESVVDNYSKESLLQEVDAVNIKAILDKLVGDKNKLLKLRKQIKNINDPRRRAELARTIADQINTISKKVADQRENLKKIASSPGAKKTYLGILGAAALIAASSAVYKKFFSKAVRACSKADNKRECIRNYKINALKAQITALRSSTTKCGMDKDPIKCKVKINAKIEKLNSQISKLQSQKK